MAHKKRVIQFIDQISDGGAETLVKDYVLNIDKSRFDISVLTHLRSDICSANYAILIEHQTSIFCPWYNEARNVWTRILRKFQNYILRFLGMFGFGKEDYKQWYIRQKIAHLQPDIIHCHMAVLKYLAPLAEELKARKVKVFYTCHNLPYRFLDPKEWGEENEAAKILIAKSGMMLIGLHQQMVYGLNRMFGVNNSIVLNNCVDLNRFRNVTTSRSSIRKSLGIPESAFVVGHVGRFAYVKNQLFLVDVFREVVKRNDKAFLLLIGAGDCLDVLALLNEYDLSDRYLILTHRRDTPFLYKAMDVFVFPSIFEGLGIAAIEAQASGLRCVLSNRIPHEIFFGSNTSVVDIDSSVTVWAEKILSPCVEEWSSNSIDDYDINNVMQVLEELYED